MIAMPILRIAYSIACLLICICNTLHALPVNNGRHFEKTADGIIVFPDAALSGNTRSVKLQVINDHIIRVSASPFEKMSPATSLTTVYTANAGTKWDVQELKDKIVLKTSRLVATVMSTTGAVLFTDINGKPILQEKPING